jgi:hypothetical protein
MEDVHRVVGGAAAGRGLPADQARVAQAAHVHAVHAVVPGAPALAGLLADAVDGARVHHRVLRRVELGRAGAEGGDRTGPEHALQLVGARQLQHVQQALHVQVPGPLRVLLAGGRQRRGQQVDLGDGGARQRPRAPPRRCTSSISWRSAGTRPCGEMSLVMTLASPWRCGQRLGQLGADLAVGADDEDLRRASSCRCGR